jgi:hypothetical protein
MGPITAMSALVLLAVGGVLLPAPLGVPLLFAGSWGVAEGLSTWHGRRTHQEDR